MPTLIDYLRKENELIRSGLELLGAYGDDLAHGRAVSAQDLRMAIYAMQIAYEASHLAKEESFLFPSLFSADNVTAIERRVLENDLAFHDKGRDLLLVLRLCVEDYDRNSVEKSLLSWRISDLIEHVNAHLQSEDQTLFKIAEQKLSASNQKALFKRANSLDQIPGMSHQKNSRHIFNQLRRARGMSAA